MKRAIFAAALAVCSASPLLAQEKAAPAPPSLPAGWQLRLDKETADPSKVSFAVMEPGFHATTGPAAILWKPTDNMKGDFRVTAKFHQMKAPTHPEAYGIFVAGKNLERADQEYGYIVIRGDGKYLIKHRAGTELHTVADWTDAASLKKQDEAGKATNTVTVEVSGGFVKFLLNGTEVQRLDAKEHSPVGLVGLRINHNLDVHISEFTVTPIK